MCILFKTGAVWGPHFYIDAETDTFCCNGTFSAQLSIDISHHTHSSEILSTFPETSSKNALAICKVI